ncbi:HAD-IA family hydrolase [Chitinibacter bivalviorum]|uniref:HAD-IA family hydrolase n=1 Tax=Chitinibacter bivalviorum TaxID=2739434 RepID=A0A7H9BIY5_9NEIS|nr:HAD-IA family hydrolase [Chitinibacter bivalviorum]QLG87951.1 HAD-IA family hydrolase [Chitinibacter bivalviorum]
MSIAVKGLLFDMDGTLVDSRQCIEQLWRNWALRHKLDFADIQAVMHGRRGIETIQIVAPHLDAQSEVELLLAEEALTLEGTVAIAGAHELLRSLAPDQWAVVTSAPRDLALAKLAFAGLPLPTHIVGADDVSEGKPHPAPFAMGAAKLGLSADQCLAFEDASAGVRSAHAAGAAVCLVTAAGGKDDSGLTKWQINHFDQVQINSNSDSIDVSIKSNE